MNSDEYISSLITSCGPVTLCHPWAPPVMLEPPATWNPSSDVQATWARNLVPPVSPTCHAGPTYTHLQMSGTHQPHGPATLCDPWHPSSDPPVAPKDTNKVKWGQKQQ